MKFKRGDKVVPHSKTEGCGFEYWKTDYEEKYTFLKKNGYLYITDDAAGDGVVTLNIYPNSSAGDYFKVNDLTFYKPNIALNMFTSE